MLVNMSIADKEYTTDIDVPSRVEIPNNRWDKENMLVKDILSVSNIKTKAEGEDEEMHDLVLDEEVERSEEMEA